MSTYGASADIGHGTTLTWATNTVDLISLSVGELTADAVESTHSASTSKWKTFFAGLKDAGSIEATINFAITEASGFTVATSGTLTVNFTGGSFSCSAVLTGYSVDVPIDGRMTAKCKWKLSGVPTWA